MTEFNINPLKFNTLSYLHSIRATIDVDPIYQRQGEVWSLAKQQLLIDSLLNGFDVPKIYLHKLPKSGHDASGKRVQYALVDGKQRLEAVFRFIDGAFSLDAQFKFLDNPNGVAGGMTYNDLREHHPDVIGRFNSTQLDVVVIETEDTELIEEMFSRLNEAVPLNAAEKRNALGGPCREAVHTLIASRFFATKLPFGNARLRHLDLAAKFLLWEDDFQGNPPRFGSSDTKTPKDTKKFRLDTFFKESKEAGPNGELRIGSDRVEVERRLATLAAVFTDQDKLLASVGMVSVYYLLSQYREARSADFPQRADLQAFEERRKGDLVPEDQMDWGEYELLEFNSKSQSPNDGSALAYRVRIMDTYISALEAGEDPMAALAERGEGGE